MIKKRQLQEGYSKLFKVGKSVLKTFSPELEKVGKKTFNKLARKGIKKFGKKGVQTAWNASKKIAKNKEVQNLAKDAAVDTINWLKDKTKELKNNKNIQKNQEELVESFSKRVNRCLNEAWGAVIKGGLTAGKAALKGGAKTIGKNGLKNISKVNGKKLASNITSAMLDDVEQMKSDAYDASGLGTLHNTFKDEKGNWSFNPYRGAKKAVKGAIKSADNFFLGGLGQMAINKIFSEDCETRIKKRKRK